MEKNCLIIGLGGMGCRIVDLLGKKLRQENRQSDAITLLALDTDPADLQKIENAEIFSMTDTVTTGTVCGRIGYDMVQDWFPVKEKDAMSLSMANGTAGWRKKAYLAFINMLNQTETRRRFHKALDRLFCGRRESSRAVYLVGSLAGGTASGILLPLSLYLKEYYARSATGEEVSVYSFLACPDVFGTVLTQDEMTAARANAYAALSEWNAVHLVCCGYNKRQGSQKPIRFRIGAEKMPGIGLLFDASDEYFARSGRAPIRQIYLQDKIPGESACSVHEEAMMESICVAVFSDVASDVDKLPSFLFAKSNAIGSVAFSQICYPLYSSILDRRTALNVANVIGETVEKLDDMALKRFWEDKECDREHRSQVRKKMGEYARCYVAVYNEWKAEEEKKEKPDAFLPDDGEEAPKDVAARIIGDITEAVNKTAGQYSLSAECAHAPAPMRIWKKAEAEQAFRDLSCGIFRTLDDAYQNGRDLFSRRMRFLQNAVFPKDGEEGKLALLPQLVKNGDEYVHPLTAMLRMCALAEQIDARLQENKDYGTPTTEATLPHALFGYAKDEEQKIRLSDSIRGYEDVGEDRLYRLRTAPETVPVSPRRLEKDGNALIADAGKTLEKITQDLQKHMQAKLFREIAAWLETAIGRYRQAIAAGKIARTALCDRAEKDLTTETDRVGNTYYLGGKDRQDAGNYSLRSVGTYRAKYGEGVSRTLTDPQIPVTDAVQSAVADTWERCRAELADVFAKKEERTVFEFLAECDEKTVFEGKTKKLMQEELQRIVHRLREQARPQFRTEKSDESENQQLTPVLMISRRTAEAICHHFNFTDSGKIDEKILEDDNGLRVAVQNLFPADGKICVRIRAEREPNAAADLSLCVLRAVTGLEPQDIEKLNESERIGYYVEYNEMLRKAKRWNSDRFNPHLGFKLQDTFPRFNDPSGGGGGKQSKQDGEDGTTSLRVIKGERATPQQEGTA